MRYLTITILSTILFACQPSKQENENLPVVNSEQNTDPVLEVLSPEKFREKADTRPGTLLDVRTSEEFQEGHLENSLNANINEMDEFNTIISDLDKSSPVYVYCRSGGRSNKAAEYLKENGFVEVYDLEGGISSWQKKGYKTVQ